MCVFDICTFVQVGAMAAAAARDKVVFFRAIEARSKGLVDEMIQANPSLLAVYDAEWDGTPLIYAILDDDDDEMALHLIGRWGPLLDLDFATPTPVYEFHSKGVTALTTACWWSRPRVVQALVEQGADPTKGMANGWTPLSLAVAQIRPAAEEIVAYLATIPSVRATFRLLFEGPDIVGLDKKRVSILGEACGKCDPSPNMVKLLLSAGADATFPGGGASPLEAVRAVKRWHPERYPALLYPEEQANFAKIVAVEAMLQASIDDSVRARCLFKVGMLHNAAFAIPAAAKDARDKGLSVAVQRQKAIGAAPASLKKRVAEGQVLPRVEVGIQIQTPQLLAEVTKVEDALESPEIGTAMLEWLRATLGMEQELDVLRLTLELPDVLFEQLLEMMVPPGDFAWRGEELGAFLARLN
jgi:hypothetical protein